MVTKEKVLEALKKFGLLPKEKEDGQILFVFQMTLYVYIPDEDDPNFLAVYIPDFFEFEDDEEDSEIMQVINECNINMKTSKIILAGPKNVWAAYEIHVPDESQLGEMVHRGVICLHDTKIKFERGMKGL